MTEPTTEAGRRLNDGLRAMFDVPDALRDILAIEAEARAQLRAEGAAIEAEGRADALREDETRRIAEAIEATGDLALLNRYLAVLAAEPPANFGSQVAMRGGLPKDVAARIDAIEAEAAPSPALDVERLHRANVGCTWDESIPKVKMCDPSWHADDLARLAREGSE